MFTEKNAVQLFVVWKQFLLLAFPVFNLVFGTVSIKLFESGMKGGVVFVTKRLRRFRRRFPRIEHRISELHFLFADKI